MMISNIQTNGRRIVVEWESQYKATHKDKASLSNQEEADKKILLHFLDAT